MLRSTTVPRSEPEKTVWIDVPFPAFAVGLAQIFRPQARVFAGQDPGGELAASIVGIAEAEEITTTVGRIRSAHPETPVLLFVTHIDLSLVRVALQAGVRGFIHATMTPQQIIRAVEVAMSGELAVPRKMLEELVTSEEPTDLLNALSHRQREILELVAEGRSNAEIAAMLYLSESTVKQHLRAVYKALDVKNRAEAARMLRTTPHHGMKNTV